MNFIKKFIVFFLMQFILSLSPGKANSETTNQPNLVMNNICDSGFFATFSAVLGALDFYDKGYYDSLKIDFDTGRYLDTERGPNWWEYFFEPINLGLEKESKYYFTISEVANLALYFFHLDRQRSFQLCQKYIYLKPDIEKEINSFVKENFKNYFVIGVHHRGTDKISETALVPYEETYRTLCLVINQLTHKQKAKLRIFVATDDQNFLKFISQRFPSQIICNDFARSKDSTPIHAYDTNFYPNNYQKGKEAVIDCFLLSRCNFLIRPWSSSLSLVATRLNPYLPVIDLSEVNFW